MVGFEPTLESVLLTPHGQKSEAGHKTPPLPKGQAFSMYNNKG